MIYYTYKAEESTVEKQFVQLSSNEESVEAHSMGVVLGVCRRVYVSEDDGLRYAEVYVAGGGGEQAILNTNWSGSPTRFDVVNSRVNPVSSGGIGWIIPEFPRASKSAGESVYISIY